MRRFTLGKTPYLRSVDEKINSTTRMMNNVIIALIPICLFAWFLYGLIPTINGGIKEVYNSAFWGLIKPIVNVLFGSLCSIGLEGLYFFLFKKVRGIKNIWKATVDSFAVIPGLILSLLFPSNIPLYVILVGCIFANIIFKMLFGGLGHNIFNPALIGYAFCVFAFSGTIADCFTLQNNLFIGTSLETIIAGSTPLATMSSLATSAGKFLISYDDLVGKYGGLLQLFVGFKNGNMGEVSGLLCLVGYLYLVFTKTINWKTPLIYVATIFGLTWIIGIASGLKVTDIWFPTYNILTGGLLFGGVFMLTEPVTTPKNPLAKTIFAIGCGVLTVLFRMVSSLPEGVGTALLFMSLFTPIIDNYAAKFRANEKTPKAILGFSLVMLLFAAVAFYTVFKATNISSELAIIKEVF